MTEFTRNVIGSIRNIPTGKVCTYGGIAALSGNPSGARQVVRVLNSLSGSYNLSWHRVVGAKGRIAFKAPESIALQKALLEREGISVSDKGEIELSAYLWRGTE